MGFGTPKIVSQESVEDKNPDLYVKRAENELSKGSVDSAIYEIDKAIEYSGNKSHYVYEKAKILYYSGKYIECYELMDYNMKKFQQNFNKEKYKESMKFYIKSIFKAGKIFTLIKAILKIFIKPVTKGQVIWLIVCILLSSIFNDIYSLKRYMMTVVGAGIIFNSILGPIYTTIYEFINNGVYYICWMELFIMILVSFIAGGFSYLIELLCVKNSHKYIFTFLLMFFSNLLLNILMWPYYFNFSSFSVLIYSYSLHYFITLVINSFVIFILKKLKKDY